MHKTTEIFLLSTPLIVVLVSLAIMPIIASKFWNKNDKSFLLIVSLISIGSSYLMLSSGGEIIYKSITEDYIPFIVTLFTLFLLSQGIELKVQTLPLPFVNCVFLFFCSILASFIGTTGASMLFLKPFMDINQKRSSKSHLLIFFIFLVSNIGGILSPLGDPPLLLGYLNGVNFFWYMKNLFIEWCIYVFGILLLVYIIDKYKFKKENPFIMTKFTFSIKIKGIKNVFLLSITTLVLFLDIGKTVLHTNIDETIIKIPILTLICLCSWLNGNKNVNFDSFKEVIVVFFAIFISIAPVVFILENNSDTIQNTIHYLEKFFKAQTIYFWLCGLSSSFLDNTPSYLLFFKIAGGNANHLMHQATEVLKAISISSVVMGSMTYIGNAPNMMVKSIAEKNGVMVPSFVGYMLWSCCIVLPISFFVLLLRM
jgi:Na+/H+ antiporter NhaD/arsenite permease-like protein